MSSILYSRLQPFARDCPDCGFQMPISRTTCPHCGRPSFFPNVDLAKLPGEQIKLKSRYDCAVVESINRGCDAIAGDFETACSRSSAAFACGIEKLYREIATGVDIFESFYDLERLRLRLTSGP
jgi:hypothetical protein